jgi:SAM-dependent methyltransferase
MISRTFFSENRHPLLSSECSSESICPVCSSADIAVILEISQLPANILLLCSTQDQALGLGSARGDIQLGFCQGCGHIFNLLFDPKLVEYTQDYENSLHFSPRFQNDTTSLATQLIERYDLHGKDIIEIGCGKGDFLKLLCEAGGNSGVGFDPSYVPQATDAKTAKQVHFIQDFYSERYASYKADLICSRQVLEHIYNPVNFLNMVRQAIGNRLNTVVFFDVPNMLFMLRELDIWNIFYEHCSYFGPSSLARVFMACGFNICNITETFGGQFLCIEALPAEDLANSKCAPGDDFKEMLDDVVAFADNYRSKVETWRSKLDQIKCSGQRAIAWGAGSRGTVFLNTLKTQDQIQYVVDINPRKQGMYIAGTGQQIVSPEFLSDYQPDVVILINPIYQSEVQQLIDSLGLTTELICA